MVSALLALGADVNQPADSDNATVIYYAAEGGHIEVVLKLLNAGASGNLSAAPEVARDNDHAAVADLLDCMSAFRRPFLGVGSASLHLTQTHT
jgi:ankyrin repeat protein